MTVKISCSTMYGEKPLFLKSNKFSDYIIINQCEDQSHERDNYLNYYEKGISRSRNRMLENANQESIIIISDNDVSYTDDVYEKVRKAFENHPEMDVLTFMFMTPEGDFTKEYKNKFFEHNKFTIGKVASIEIALKMKFIKKNNLKFDENFGLGSKYETGEEFIFLSDVLKKGGRIGFVPEIIAFHPKEASGSNFKNRQLIEAKGAMVNRVFGMVGLPICLLFTLKKFKNSQLGFIQFFIVMITGYFKSKKI